MKRILAILLCGLLLAGCGKAVPSETPGTTEAVTLSTEAVSTETDSGPEGILEEKETDTVYLLTRMTVRSGERPEDWRREYVYDEAGRVVEEFDYTAGYTLTARRTYSYNEKGLLEIQKVEHISHEDSEKVEMTLTTQYTYDDRDLMILLQVYENGAVSTSEACTYDEAGRLTQTVTSPGGAEEIRYITRNTYSEDGLLVEKEEIFEDELVYRTVYAYDETGRLLSTEDFDVNGNRSGAMTVTWEGSTKTVVYYDMTGEIYLTEVTTYTEDGDPTLSESVYADGEVVTTEYTYEPYEIQK